jgi:transposase-like protein
MADPFRYFNSSPEIIRLTVMMYVRYPLSLRQVEDLLFERGIDICHETVRFWWNRFGPMFAGVHASLHNHFALDRHLNSRDDVKQIRTAAMAEWRKLAA